MENKLTVQQQTSIANLKKEYLTLLEAYNPQTTNNQIKTVEDVISVNAPSLVKMSRVMGREFVVNLIKAWLIHLNEITNAKQKLSPSSINFIADTIYDDYSLRVTDLYLFFRKVRKNDYGKKGKGAHKDDPN